LLNKEISTLHLTHKDRLLRFGHELVFQICRWAKKDVVIYNEAAPKTFEEELCKDVITLMTVFNARLYGKRSHENRQKREAVQVDG
jgi:putative resolvase